MWELVITVALKLLGFYLKYTNSSDEAKRAYLIFIKSMEPHSKSCVRARESYDRQVEANLKKIQEMKNGSTENSGN